MKVFTEGFAFSYSLVYLNVLSKNGEFFSGCWYIWYEVIKRDIQKTLCKNL